MPAFGQRSIDNLKKVHPDLVRVAMAVIPYWDCQVVDGVRTIEEQVKNMERGVSKTMKSKHLPQADGLSHAIDIVPYPIDWKDLNRMYAFGGFVLGVAQHLGVRLRWGADWDSDRDFKDHTFIDLPHFELSEAA